MESTIGTYTTNRNLGKIRVSKPISRAAAVIGMSEFLLGAGMLITGTLLYTNDVTEDIDIESSEFPYYGLWSAPGPLIVSVFGVIAWLVRKRTMIITFSVINVLNIGLCIAQAVFVLPVTFWYKDFLTLSKCREENPNDHGLDYDPSGEDTSKRDCHDMYSIAQLFIALSVCCVFAIVFSIAGIITGILGVRKMKTDQIEQLEGMTNEEFRHMENKTALWLENNVRLSTGSTLARSERTVSEGALSNASTIYKDKSWV